MWSGLGLNIGNDSFASYNSTQVNADLDYLRDVGITRLRVAMPDYGDSTAVTNMRTLALAAKSRGFHVSYGVSFSVPTSNWTAYDAAVLTNAAWAQTNGIEEYQVGNEFENRKDGTLTELAVRNHMRQLATDVKAAGYTGKVSYSAGQGIGDKSGGWADNPGEGLGGLDYISVNSYGWWQDNIARFVEFVQDLVTAYGADKVYASEFNIHHEWALVTYGVDGVANAVRDRLEALIATGVPRGYFYTWRTSNNDFAAKRTTGDFHPLWPLLIGARPWFTGVPNVAVGRGVTPTRGNTPNRLSTPARDTL